MAARIGKGTAVGRLRDILTDPKVMLFVAIRDLVMKVIRDFGKGMRDLDELAEVQNMDDLCLRGRRDGWSRQPLP